MDLYTKLFALAATVQSASASAACWFFWQDNMRLGFVVFAAGMAVDQAIVAVAEVIGRREE